TWITVMNPTTIIVTVPAHSVGNADVTVTTTVGTGTLVNGYTYLGASLETTTTVSASPNPSVEGQNVEITATVAGPDYGRGIGAPTGTVTFTGPGGLNQTVALDSSGAASLTSASLTTGTVTATYNGDSDFIGSTGTVGIVVNPTIKMPTTTSVSATPDHSVEGQSVEL